MRDNSLSPETGKKTSREEKHGESDEEDRNTKKRKVEDDDVVIVQKSEKNDHNDDEEVQIIEVRTAKDDDFRIRVGEEGRSISLKES